MGLDCCLARAFRGHCLDVSAVPLLTRSSAVWLPEAIAESDLSICKSQQTSTTTNVPPRSLIQVITKQYVGAFRPYFLSACNPDIAILEELARQSATSAGNEYLPYHRVFATSRICHPTNEHHLWTAMHSWPSGHTGTAFTVGIFLSLYLNAKLKAFSNYRTGFWKMFAITAPLIGAILIAGGLTIDHNHHASDILTSIPLGIFAGLLAYRAKYLSLFDYRTNHIPLVHGGIGQSVPAPVQPVGDYAAIRWPKPPLGGLPLNSGNLPGGPGGLDGAVPNLPTSAPTRPGLPSAGTNETVVPISRRRQSREASNSEENEENDVRVNASVATAQRGEQMV